MSFIKSKHSGWTWELKRTPFGGGGGGGGFDPFSAVSDAVSSASDAVSSGFSDLGLGGSAQPLITPALDVAAVASGNPELIPAINAGSTYAQTGDLGQAAISGGTAFATQGLSGLASSGVGTSNLTDMIGQDAISMQAQGLSSDQISQALQQSYGIDQYAAANAAGIATGGGTAANIASNLAGDYGTNMTGVPASQGTSLGDILKTASSGAGIIGGLAKMAGGVGAIQAGQQAGQYAKQADPFAQYRSGYAAQLSNLLSNPQTVTTTPGYQFNLAQGLQGLQAQQAAQGRLVSGGALIQGQQYGQQLASQGYQQQLQNLAQLSGATQSPATGATAQAGLTAGQLGGVLGGAQSISGGLGQVLNPLATLYSQYNNPSPSADVPGR
jgi:hypothetical protein